MRFLVLLVFCPAAICYNFDEDFNSLYEQSCGACIFNHSEVTTQTIDLWPSNCKFICTVLTFTANSNDIPLEKLNSTFKNLTKIKGSLRVENTSFTNLSFLDSVKSVYNYAFLDLSIKNNPNLIEAKVLYAVEYTFTNSPINVVNNTKLDASQLCVNENYGEFVRMYVYNNKKDCGCIGTNFTTANVKNYKNCTAMYGALEIANIPDASSFAGLEKLKTITGNITIHSTGFQNLSFFKNLISIVGDEDDDVPTLSIQDNPNMTRLSINSLTKLYNVKSWFYMSIKNNHPSFCLTMEEMQFFTSTNTKFTNIQAVYCNTTIRKDNQKTCIFGTWSTLDSDCVHLMGKVVIGSGDEGYSGKLSTVKNIYGSLTIQNTTLSDIRFLSNLTNVALLNDTIPAVQLINNFNLSDVSLPKMMYPFTPGPSRVIISNNAPDIFLDVDACYNYEQDMGSAIVYNGANCKSCIFNQSEVTTQTIDLWPSNCTSVCTVLTFTANSNDIPLDKLKTVFKKLDKIKGSIRVDNTSFANLSFLDSVRWISNIAFLDLSINNNPNLIEAKVLYNVRFSFTDSPINVVNNTKFDASLLCVNKNYGDFVKMYVYNNKKDCGCIGTNFTTVNVNDYKNCTAMYGAIEIANVSDVSNFGGLANLKTITGNMTVHNTGFQNLSFFKNLISIVGDEKEGVPTLNIQDNLNMTRLAFDNLTKLYNVKEWFYISIKNNHPSFCLTMEEMQFFTSTNTKFTNIQAVYCNTTIRKDNQKACLFGSWSTLDSDCVHLIGKVVIGYGDEGYTGKLSTVKNIYGSLTIQNTTLSDIRFLGNLTNVALLNDTIPAIQLVNNFNLSDLFLPKMAFPFTPGPSRVVISNNAPDIFPDAVACSNYEQEIKSAVVYNGADCSGMMLPDYGEETGGTDGATRNFGGCLTYFTSFLLIFIIHWLD